MFDRSIDLIRRGYDDRAGFDTGVSHALLERVSSGQLGETIRISVPGRVVAFGKRDTHAPGFGHAVDLARQHGYSAVIRLPGGRAAAFHEQTISFAWTIPEEDPVSGVRSRFEAAAAMITRALARVDIASAIGEVPGEYCSGEYSVNHAGRIKLAGLGQRLARRAAHVGGVLVVGGATRIRNVLVPVYEALDVPMDPRTVGAADDVNATIETDAVIDALIETMSEHATMSPATFDDATLERAADLAVGHAL